MDGQPPTASAFLADFVAYLIKVILCIGLSLFAIHRLHDAFGAGVFVGSARSAPPAFETRTAGQAANKSVLSYAHAAQPGHIASREHQKTNKAAEAHIDDKKEPLQTGKASFYGKKWSGRKTANGEIFDHRKYTAAHKKLPFGTYVRVVRPDSEHSVVVRINDRGPFVKGRVIDLSSAAAAAINMTKEGIVAVEIHKSNVAEFLKQFEKDK